MCAASNAAQVFYQTHPTPINVYNITSTLCVCLCVCVVGGLNVLQDCTHKNPLNDEHLAIYVHIQLIGLTAAIENILYK